MQFPQGRIFLNGATQRLRGAVSSDPFACDVGNGILAEAAALRARGPLALTFEKGRTTILPTSRDLARRVFTFGLAQVLDGRSIHAGCAVQDLDVAARLADWNADHFLDAAEMAAAAAIGYSWFNGFQSPPERRRLREAVIEKGLEPGLRGLSEGAFWAECDHNWNVVCCGALIVAALAMGGAADGRSEAILRIAPKAFAKGLSSFGADGSWPEGPTYWEYAARYAVLAIEALAEGGMADSPAIGGLARGWRYARHMTGPSGRSFDYGDSVAKPERSPVLGWLARKDKSVAAACLQRRGGRGETHPLDLLFLSDPPVEVPAAELDAVFEAGSLAAFRSSDAQNALFVAVKGGSNAANHAHRDLGTFVLDAGGERFVEDLGREDYGMPGYFDPELRPGFTRTGSAAHNVVTIDGIDQSGAATAFLVASVVSNALSAAVLDIRDPASPVRQRRGVALVARRSVVVVDQLEATDELPPGAGAEWRIHTSASVETAGNDVRLRIGGAEMRLRVVEPKEAAIVVRPVPLRPGERPANGVRRLQLQPVPIGRSRRFAVVFSPHEPEAEELRLAATPLDAWCAAA